MIQRIRIRQQAVVKTLHEPIQAAHAAHKHMVRIREDLLAPLRDMEQTLKQRLTEWHDAERRRAAAESARIAEELRRQMEETALREAASLESAGLRQEAEEALNLAVSAPPPAVPVRPVAVKGTTFRKQWTWELVDADRVPREYLCLDVSKINAVVKALGDQAEIPGIRVYARDIVAVRGLYQPPPPEGDHE